MQSIDLHCHIPNETFQNDLQTWIKKWKQNEVAKIVAVAMDLDQSRQSISQADEHEMFLSATGIHPWNITKSTGMDILQQFEEVAKQSDMIGEVGLDYHFVKDDRYYPLQYDFFKNVLEIAKKLNKPLTLHTKGAEKDVVNLLQETEISSNLVSIHWYSGPIQELQTLIEMGVSFSIGPAVLYSKPHQRVVELTPESQILVESDGDVKYQGRLGHPGLLSEVIEQISNIKRMDPKEMGKIIYQNSQEFLGL